TTCTSRSAKRRSRISTNRSQGREPSYTWPSTRTVARDGAVAQAQPAPATAAANRNPETTTDGRTMPGTILQPAARPDQPSKGRAGSTFLDFLRLRTEGRSKWGRAAPLRWLVRPGGWL